MPRALLSVYDKTGVVELAKGLISLGFEIVSTGGTHAAIAAAGLAVTSVSEVTAFPEILDGRVKTLHPRIHGGLLGRPELPEHRAAMIEHGIDAIDLLAVNLYPFEATVGTPGVSLADAVEQIDIGGPAMIRAGSKNFANVIVLTNPDDYPVAIETVRAASADLPWRQSLAAKAFRHVARYDAIVADYLGAAGEPFPDELTIPARSSGIDLRYGENPHQAAAAYRVPTSGIPTLGVLDAAQLGGKTLSYNNILDADAASAVVRSFPGPAAIVVKHTIPCGVATAVDVSTAATRAIASDPVSAFGGIVALNREVDEATAHVLSGTFLEVILAPSFSPAGLAMLRKKPQLRLLALPNLARTESYRGRDVRSIYGGLLIQERDEVSIDPDLWTVVTVAQPTETQLADLAFAWAVVRHAKSNAIVLASGAALVGLGSGQPNRLDAVRHALDRAGGRAPGAVLASDAFFPFPDGVEVAAAAGITAIAQPGGSKKDGEVIAAADAAGVSMLFTAHRHFRH